MAHKDGVFCDEGFKCTKCKEAWGKPTQIEQLTARVRELEEEIRRLEKLVISAQNAAIENGVALKSTQDQLAKAEQRVAEWQPIDTAPKDGTVFLGYKLGQFRECYKVPRDDCDMWCFGGTSGADDLFPNIKPTHWMPLPKAPNGASS